MQKYEAVCKLFSIGHGHGQGQGNELCKMSIEAILTGITDPASIKADDLQYVCDLGLIRPKTLEIANPIYREIIPRN